MSNPFYFFTFIDFILLTCIFSLGIVWVDSIVPLRKLVYISLKIGFLGYFELNEKNARTFKFTCRVINIIFIFIMLHLLIFLLQHLSYISSIENILNILIKNSKIILHFNEHNIFNFFGNLFNVGS